MPFQPNVILKGRATVLCLPPTIVHIFSQWGSLMCEQASGRALNRPFYEVARGELGCQWRGLSHRCHVSTLNHSLFVLMAARDWRDCRPCLHRICVKQESSPSVRNGHIRPNQNPTCNAANLESSLVWSYSNMAQEERVCYKMTFRTWEPSMQYQIYSMEKQSL